MGARYQSPILDTTISDADSTNLVLATITLTNPQTDDTARGQRRAARRDYRPQHTTRYRYPHAHRLCHAGSYEAALRQISYSNSGDNPATDAASSGSSSTTARTSVIVADAVIGIAAANDAPALVVCERHLHGEDPPLALSPLASVTDPMIPSSLRDRGDHRRIFRR
jgi:hypothetical protein